ncbi:MAG: prepilin-type N-terminal cleavage/methylation domain-containing protein [Firmicutes bacterium]|nr:prepilin-type N-terminal cleavage/methylation domain-containing protein [Bacillota bacterium]
MIRRKHSRGFTLFEIALVIVIIGILFVILVYSVQKAKDQSKWKQCSSNISMIANAMQMYSNNNSYAYPPDLAHLTPRYLQEMPTCPSSGNSYHYEVSSDWSRFTLYCEGSYHTGAGVTGPNMPSWDFDNVKVQQQ